MRSILFLGKGGVGKTTSALGAALAAARRGRRTLVASIDPAHSLGDLAGFHLGDAPRALEPRLDALEVDLEGRRRRAAAEVADLARRSHGHLAALGLGSMTGLLAHAPGMEEGAALEALASLVQAEGPELLVLDMPATALACRLLALPALTEAWLERLDRLRRTILERRRSIEHIRKAGDDVPPPDRDPVLAELGQEGRRTAAVGRWLAAEETAFALVVNPDVLSLREARRIAEVLAELGRAPNILVLNRDRGVEPPTGLDALARGAPLVRLPGFDRPHGSLDELAAHGEPIRAALGMA